MNPRNRTPVPARGRDFRERRRRAGLTQAYVGYKAGVSQAFVSRFEAGRDILLSQWDRLNAALTVRPYIPPAFTSSNDGFNAANVNEDMPNAG